ncbi:MAG: HAD hydrolase family protein [Candidatus Bathyarchaeia archaeon]|jgi:energy-converting hydrogenase A subunit R
MEPNRHSRTATHRQKHKSLGKVEEQSVKRIFVSDCEGPISKNDNAYEIAANFIPNGDIFFCNVSKYDDVLADAFKKPNYTAGNTLRLILPFLKAYGVTDPQMEDFSANNIILIANTRETLKHILSIADAYIVSTSYEHYIKALCKAVDFPYKNTYCTKVSLDKAPITPPETKRLREMAQEISQMPLIEIPTNAKSLEDFRAEDQELIKRLDEIFWSEIPRMVVGKFFSDVVTVGGEQKAESIRDVVKRLDVPLEGVMYVGDSITDVEAFQLVRENGGLAVSFNGNSYAVRNADVAVVSESNLVTSVIADMFCRFGKAETFKVVKSWSKSALEAVVVDSELVKQLFARCDVLPKVQIVTNENMNSIVTESSEFRKKVRGVAIGRLG